MKAKAVLCAAVLASLVAAGCSKAEKETGRRVAAEESRAPRTDNLYDHLGLERLRKVTVTRGPTMDLTGERVVTRSTAHRNLLARIESALRALPPSSDVHKKFSRETTTSRILLEGEKGRAELTMYSTTLRLPGGGFVRSDSLAAAVRCVLAEASEDKIAWGEAANGLQAGLEIKGRRFEEGEPIEVAIHVRKVGERELKLLDGERDMMWRVVFAPKGGGTPRRAGRFNIWARESRRASFLDLAKAAEKVAVRCKIAGTEWQFTDAKASSYEAVRRSSTNTLPPGGYTVTASYQNAEERPWSKGCWCGKIQTGPVEIQIAAKGGAADPAE